MIKSKIISSYKTLKHHAFLCSLLCLIFILFKEIAPLSIACILLTFWFYKTKDYTLIFVVFLFLYCYFPLQIPSNTNEYRVSYIAKNYIVLNRGFERFIYYTNEDFIYDTKLMIEAKRKQISETKGFYNFNFKEYLAQENIHYQLEISNYTISKDTHSLRGLLQKRINNHSQKELLNRFIFGIKSEEYPMDSFLNEVGFRYSSILYVLGRCLKGIKKKKRENILLGIHIFLCIFYHLPLLLTQSLVYRLLKKTNLSSYEQFSFGLLLGIILFPYSIFRISFVFPTIFRVLNHFYPNQRWKRYWVLLFVQSYYFKEMNILSLFLFPLLIFSSGLLSILSFLNIYIPSIPLMPFTNLFNKFYTYIQMFQLPGSFLGFGILAYVIICSFLKGKKYQDLYWIIFLLVFQYFGLFHPFSEVSFINVGQGDAILIRLPLNQGNILVDTGKPTKENTLDIYLKALGIKQIDTLIITHQDDDHAGNLSFLMDHYKVSHLIKNHQKEIHLKDLTIYDINEIQNENENQSSIVNYFEFNRFYYLLMGDGDEFTEREIIQKYPGLVVDVLKVGHHGSKTSSSTTFLNQIQPKLAIISCGHYNIYHHPSEEIIERYQRYRIPYLTTYNEGDIRIINLWKYKLLITSTLKIAIM